METENIFFTESASDSSLEESGLSEYNFQLVNSPGGNDEDEEEDDDSDEDTEETERYRGDDSSGDGEPPLDKDIKHSPVTTLPGGPPKQK